MPARKQPVTGRLAGVRCWVTRRVTADSQASQSTVYMSDKPKVSEDFVIRKYLGRPYKMHGRQISGLDCYGLIILIYADLGYKLWDIEEEYNEEWGWQGKDYFLENYHRQWIKLLIPKLFDVVLFKNSSGAAIHGGVVIGKGRFIHCVKNTGVITSRLSDWKRKLEGFYRIR